MSVQDIICKHAIEKFGEVPQIIMTMEELAELTQALSKHLRGVDNKENVAEEIADVEIMLTQMKLLFDNQKSVDKYITEKLQKLSIRVNPPCIYSCFVFKNSEMSEAFLVTPNISKVRQWCKERYDNIKLTELLGGEESDIFYYKDEKLKKLLLKYPELRLNVYATRKDVDNNNPLYTICINTTVVI